MGATWIQWIWKIINSWHVPCESCVRWFQVSINNCWVPIDTRLSICMMFCWWFFLIAYLQNVWLTTYQLNRRIQGQTYCDVVLHDSYYLVFFDMRPKYIQHISHHALIVKPDVFNIQRYATPKILSSIS